MTTIVDFGMGNLRSIQHKMLRGGIETRISGEPTTITEADLLILPGVGHFATGMTNLRERGLIEVLNQKVIKEGTPVMGICLGMQLMTNWSEEGEVAGLGWLDAVTRRFRFNEQAIKMKVPHMGWTTIKSRRSSQLLEGIAQDQRFYFVHSYYVFCNEPNDVLATSHYGHEFPSVVQRDHIFGAQFHPEKSHRRGMQLISNFVRYHRT